MALGPFAQTEETKSLDPIWQDDEMGADDGFYRKNVRTPDLAWIGVPLALGPSTGNHGDLSPLAKNTPLLNGGLPKQSWLETPPFEAVLGSGGAGA